MRSVFILVFFCGFLKLAAQTDSTSAANDSIQRDKETKRKIYSGPRRASIKSAIIPGLGQIQNKKYWKVPVIYAAMGGCGYLFQINNARYKDYRTVLKYSLDNGGQGTIDGTTYSTSNLQILKLQYKKNRDRAAIGIVIVYVLNIIDANVDAHLKTFDVSDDLSLMIEPDYYFLKESYYSGSVAGLSLKLNIK